MSNNLLKVQIIETLALKRKMNHHFMKRGDNISEGGNHKSDSLFLFSKNMFQSFTVSKMSAKESFVDKLQI
jgi:hypothetical protein